MAASQTVVGTLLAALPRVRDGQEQFYRDLHRHPELSHQEVDTARKVADRLRGWGYETHDGVGGTGVVGVLANGPGPLCCFARIWMRFPCKKPPGSSTPAPCG